MSCRPGPAAEVPAGPGWGRVMAAVGPQPGRHDAQAVVHRLVDGAVDAVPGADAGGVAELTGDDVRCRVVTLPVVEELHRVAVARAEGPVPEAVRARPGRPSSPTWTTPRSGGGRTGRHEHGPPAWERR